MQKIGIGFVVGMLFSAGLVVQGRGQNPGGQTAGQQRPAEIVKTYASSSEVAALLAKAKSERKAEPNIVQPILRLAPYVMNVEYRASVGNPNAHPGEAEIFYVIDGTATMVTGGRIVNNRIEGGSSRSIATGDFVIVPENTPHWFSEITGTLRLMSMHVPRPVQGQ